MLRFRVEPLCVFFAAVAGFAASGRAQDYWDLERIARQARLNAEAERAAGGPFIAAPLPGGGGEDSLAFTFNDPIAQLREEARFLTRLQVTTPGPDLGGMREGESLLDIVQTDNTTESIWVFSRHLRLTGDAEFDPNTALAWVYVMSHPATAEEGGSGPNGYYRVYNCGWAVVAEPEYRAATGDASFLPYARTCAAFIASNPLDLRTSLNVQVEAWAAGALRDFAVEQGDESLRLAANRLGDAVRAVVEANPSVLAQEQWAMSGGSVLWGVLRAWFADQPGGRAWANLYGPMTSEIDPVGVWRLAATNWYGLGRHEAWRATGNPEFFASHRSIHAFLMDADGDDDGGIPTTDPAAVTADETWVSNYFSFMFFDKAVPGFEVVLAADAASAPAGGSWSISAAVANHDAAVKRSLLIALAGRRAGSDRVVVLAGPATRTIPRETARGADASLRVPPRVRPGDYVLTLVARDAAGGPVLRSTLSLAVQ